MNLDKDTILKPNYSKPITQYFSLFINNHNKAEQKRCIKPRI